MLERTKKSLLSSIILPLNVSTVVGDEKLISREDLIGLLFVYIQSDEDTLLKVDEVSKTEAQAFNVFNQLVSRFEFRV